MEDFDVYDLSNAVVAGEALSPLQFDKTNYTSYEEFIQRINALPEKPIKVSNKSLSVHGRVSNDSMEKYLSVPAESSSALKEVLKTPRHYLIYKNQQLKPKDTSHFELGTFCHSAFLEPTKFNKVIVEPKYSRSESEGLRQLIQFYWELLKISPDVDLSSLKTPLLKIKLSALVKQAKDEGFILINETNNIIINVIRPSYKIYGGGILPRLAKYLKAETSMYGKDSSTGLSVKIRPDALGLEENFGINFIVSFKTTSATSIDSFLHDCAKFKYELTEGMYLDVASHITNRQFSATLMVMIQTVIPYQIALIYWDAEDLQIGKYKYYQAMDIVKNCKEANKWPGFDCLAEDSGIIQGKLPNYIKKELFPQYINEI